MDTGYTYFVSAHVVFHVPNKTHRSRLIKCIQFWMVLGVRRLHQDLLWEIVAKIAASKHLMEKIEPNKIRRLQQASVDKREMVRSQDSYTANATEIWQLMLPLITRVCLNNKVCYV